MLVRSGLIGVAIAAVLAALLACKQPSGSSGGSPIRERVVAAPGELLKSYQDNQVAADAVYKGKRLAITGVVDSVKTTFLGGVDLHIGTGAKFEIMHVTCNFKPAPERLSKLKPGDSVSVEGDCDGGTSFGVQLTNCVFQ